MSEWAVEAVVRARTRRVSPAHYRMDKLNPNGPLAVDGVRRHPRGGQY